MKHRGMQIRLLAASVIRATEDPLVKCTNALLVLMLSAASAMKQVETVQDAEFATTLPVHVIVSWGITARRATKLALRPPNFGRLEDTVDNILITDDTRYLLIYVS